MSDHVLIDTPGAWREAARALEGVRVIGVDVEADGFHRYPERTSLIQLSVPGKRPWLVDPLAIADLSALGAVLADPGVRVIFHASGFDIRALHRDFGFEVRGLRDTAVAAQLAGLKLLGLGNVLDEVLGIQLSKPKRLQRFDWSIRPLPEDALDYAAGDVAHLFALDAALEGRLERLGRLAWLAEECARIEDVRFDPPLSAEQASLKLKGAIDLSDRGRATLAALLAFREAEALRAGRPPHFILSNASLLSLASDPKLDLSRLPGAARRFQGPAGRRLQEALQAGASGPPLPWPRTRGRNPWTPEAKARLGRLKRWRTAAAAELGIDAGMVWSGAHLERIALEPDAARADLRALDEGEPPWVRDWQWTTLGASLAEVVEGFETV